MPPETSAEIVRQYIAAGNSRDYESLNALRTEDFVAHVPRGGAISESEPIGAPALNSDLQMITGSFPDLENTIQDLLATDDRVVVRAQLQGTFSAPLGDLAPTGARITWDSVHLYRLDAGKIAEAWFVTDTLGLLRQADAVTMKVGQQ